MCFFEQHTPLLLGSSLAAKLSSAHAFSSRLYLLDAVLLQVPWLEGCNLVVRDTADNCLERLEWISFVLACAKSW